MSSNQRRHLGGQPTGGQFAPWNHRESKVELMTTKQPLFVDLLIHLNLRTQKLFNELAESGLGGEAYAGSEEDSVDWTPADGVGTFRVVRTGDDYLVYEVPEGDGRPASDAESRDSMTAKKPEEAIECMKMLRANSLGRKIASSISTGKVSRVDLHKEDVLHDGRFQEQLEADVELGAGDGAQYVLHYETLVDRLEIRRDGRPLGGDELEAAAADLCGTTAAGSAGVSPLDHLKKATAQLIADVKASDDVAFRPDIIEL